MANGLLGGLGGLFGGLGQGLQGLLAMRQADQERADRQEQLAWARRKAEAEPQDTLNRIRYENLLRQGVDISPQDYARSMAQGTTTTPAMPAMAGNAALGTRGAAAQAAGPERGLQPDIARTQSGFLQDIQAGRVPQSTTLPQYNARVSPSESLMIAAMQRQNRLPSGLQQVSGLPPGSPMLQRQPDTGETQPILGPDGKPLMTPPEKMERAYYSKTGAVESAGDAARVIPAQKSSEALEKLDPSLPGRVMQKVNLTLGAAPKLRNLLIDDSVVRTTLFQAMDRNEQAYWTSMLQFSSGLLRKEIGSQQTVQEFVRQMSAWYPIAEPHDPSLIVDYTLRRRNEIQKAIDASLGAFHDLWVPRLKAQQMNLDEYDTVPPGEPRTWKPAAAAPNKEGTAPAAPQTLEDFERELGIRP